MAKTKRNFIIIMSIIAVLFSVVSPSISAFADDANEKFDKEVDKYIGDAENFSDVAVKIIDEGETNVAPKKDTIFHVMKRLFSVGEYINDVEDGVLSNKLDVKKKDILVDDRYACNPDAPNNLINHNCNIPNFTTGLIQTVASPIFTPFNKAGKTSAYSPFGLGVPNNIPGGTVPVNPEDRAHRYTALELYGYDLKLTSYNGEWDNISVSTEARILSNFGVIDTVTLMGTSLWNSVSSGVSSFIENFSFNPKTWFKSIAGAYTSAISGGLNTVIDTSDLNIVATGAWKRDDFNSTLYNVYVLTDKEVIRETHKLYFRKFVEELKSSAELSPELLEVLDLEHAPGFTYIPDWETEESIKAREEAEAFNAKEDEKAKTMELEGYVYEPYYMEVPEPVYYTEKEQLEFWHEENEEFLNRAKKQGLFSGDIDDYGNYEAITAKWEQEWATYSAREFNASGDVVSELIEISDQKIFKENPHLDPKQAISHYACANDDGTIMRDENGNIEYLYEKSNKGDVEYLNPKCSKVRPPIGGGLFGSGWHIERKPDTRHISEVSDFNILSMYFGRVDSIYVSVSRSLNSFIAKVTNVILGFSFSPILSELGIDTMVETFVEGFRDTIFFPLAALMATLGGILLFLQMLRDGSVFQTITSAFIILLIFIAGAAFLMTPGATLKIVDEIPNKMDNFLANAVLSDGDGSSYCSTGSDEDGIRSAQCNVWGIMVFNPWVHLQFGTGYDNLYAKGYAPPGGKSFNNTNEDLVGNAEVYMGGGHTLHNWAIYQLDKTKAGTINVQDYSNDVFFSRVDKDMYRLVDLQAGPNNGAGTDSRYFETWSGKSGNIFINILTNIQAITASIAISSLGFLKIEASLLFSLNIIFLPFMLLYSLLPKGRMKLKSYMATLVTLLVRRSIITIMLAVLLKTITLSYSSSESIVSASMISIFISFAFILYRKELLNMIASTENGAAFAEQVKQVASDTVPKGIKQRYSMMISKVKGTAAGFAGGAIASLSHRKTLNNKLNDIQDREKVIKRELTDLNKKKENSEGLSSEDKEVVKELTRELMELDIEKEGVVRAITSKSNNPLKVAIYGARDSNHLISRKTERSIRKEGFSMGNVSSQASKAVIISGSDRITNKDEPTALDTYREILSHGISNRSKTTERNLGVEEADLLRDPKVQKEVRRLAKQRQKLAKKNRDNPEFTALHPNKQEMQKIAREIDLRRKNNALKNKAIRPMLAEEMKREAEVLRKKKQAFSNVKDIIEDEIRKQKEREEKAEQKGKDENGGE